MTESPRVCLLTQYFPPEMGAPPVRLWELAERLTDLGWRVEALTALPNYPTGRIYDGYDPGRVMVESVGRIRTIRVPLTPSKGGFVKRIASYFSFVRSVRRYGPRHCTRPDILFVESPPLFIYYAARYLSRKWRCPYVFNVSDLWPESVVRLNQVRSRTLLAMARRLEASAYRRSAGVTGQSAEIIDAVRRTAPGVPTEVITNGVDPERFQVETPPAEVAGMLNSLQRPVFLYAGLFGLAQGLDAILDLAKAWPESTPGHFLLVGDGPCADRLARRLVEERISRVTLLPRQPRELIPSFLALSDIALVTLGASIPGAVPSKIYEAMAASLPILLVADGEAANRVQAAQCGITVPPGDAAGLLAAACRLAADQDLRTQLGAAGRRAAETTYNRNEIAAKLDRFLRSALAGRIKLPAASP